MMQLGRFQFGLSTAAYQELRRSTQFTWAEQQKFGRLATLQFTGPGSDTITLTGVIYPEFMGGGGRLSDLRALGATGKPQQLLDGDGNLMGMWVIESVEEGQSVFAGYGKPRKQEFTLNIRKRSE